MIAFRADGNSKIGSGHIMRCLSIADAASFINEECSFIMASSDFSDMVDSRGYKHYELGTDYRNMEIENLAPILERIKPSIVVVDSFSVTPKYLNLLHTYCTKQGIILAYIDDSLLLLESVEISHSRSVKISRF